MKTDIAYIYALIDPRDNTFRYIGKTISPKIRISGHLAESKRYDHYRAKWIRSLLKINLVPTLKILKICPLEDFVKYETEYIKIYQSDILTNSDETGQGSTRRKSEIIEAAAEKISRYVYQFSLDSKLISKYKSTRDAARSLNISHANISRCCNGLYKHAGGFIFSYSENIKIISVSNPNASKKSVIEVDEFGIEINRWKSLMDCSRDTKIDNGNISRVCNNIYQSTSGRVFKFIF